MQDKEPPMRLAQEVITYERKFYFGFENGPLVEFNVETAIAIAVLLLAVVAVTVVMFLLYRGRRNNKR